MTNNVSLLRAVPILVRSRVDAIFMWTWCTAVSCLVASSGSPPLIPTLKAIVAIIFITLSVYLYNDVRDRELDRNNPIKNWRPVASNIVSPDNAMKMIYVFGFIGIATAFSINLYSFFFSLLHLTLFTMYSYPKIHLKKRMVYGELTIALGWPLVSLIGSYAITKNIFNPSALFAGILLGVFTFFAYPAMADSSDVEVDLRFGVKKLASVLSWKRKMQLLIFSVLVIMTITPLTYVNLKFNILLPIFVVASSLIFLGFMIPITNKVELQVIEIRKFYRISYAYFMVISAIFILGSLKLALSF